MSYPTPISFATLIFTIPIDTCYKITLKTSITSRIDYFTIDLDLELEPSVYLSISLKTITMLGTNIRLNA